MPSAPDAPLSGGWDFTPPRDPHAAVAIAGTGLSIVDHVTTLLAARHEGPIHAISRRGLLPQAHAPSCPLTIARSDVPLGVGVSRTLRWLRNLVRQAERAGGTWRDAVDGIRPHVAAIWQDWSLAERARFLRHAAALWEEHRHRMTPISAERIGATRDSGQLRIHRARFDGAARGTHGRIDLTLSPRGAGRHDHLVADHVLDCRGIRRDPATHAVPVVRDLVARGAARLDPLALGLKTTPCARLISRDGTPSARLHAIGPAARGAIWEITAIPNIRAQTIAIAERLCRKAGVLPAAEKQTPKS